MRFCLNMSVALPYGTPFHNTFFRRSLAAFLLVSLFLILPDAAQAQQTERITFNQAVDIALDRNVTLRRTQNSVTLQASQVTFERAQFLPNLNVNSGANRNWGLTFDQTTGQTFTSVSDGFNVSANSGINVFNGFADVASLNQAKHNLESNEYTFARTRQAVVFNVIQNYLTVILDQEQIQIRTEDVEAQRQQLARIEEFTRVGSRPISDQYQQEALAAQSELQLLEAERAAQLSQARLIQTMQLDPTKLYEFEAPSADDIGLLPRQYNPNDLLQSAYEQRADLHAQESAISANSEGIRASKASYFPTLSMSAGLSTRYSSQQRRLLGLGGDDSPIFESVPFGDQLGDNRSQFIGFNLSIPIFNRLITRTNVERARVQYDNARLDLENLQQSIALEVRQAYLDYQTDIKRLEVTEKQLTSAQQALQVEQERYNVGASTLVELTQARSSFVQASSNRVQAIYQFHFQHKLIEYYQGILDPSQPLFR